jgi:putative heme iron utilization protein
VGLGLFARAALHKGDPICEYQGPRLPTELHRRGYYVLKVW